MLNNNQICNRVGPHVDQDARDRLDDWGLVVTDGVVVGAVTGRMEVVG